MNPKFSSCIWPVIFGIALLLQACGANKLSATATAVFTNTPEPPKPTSTLTPMPVSASNTLSGLRPTRTPNRAATQNAEAWKTSQAQQAKTPKATRTPNLAATQQMEEWNAEVQRYFEAGYLTTPEGKFIRYNDFVKEWAQLNWYQWWTLSITASDFYMSAHFKWSSAYRSADISGCGFAFAIQDNGDNYAVFLDRSQVYFIDNDQSYSGYRPMGRTRGTGRVNFGNPADKPAEADFTLIVKDAYAYVLVDGEVVSEYTLAQSRPLRGNVGLTLLSGTNKDFGTRCEITNLHLWIPEAE